MVSVSGGATPIAGTSTTLLCSATNGNPSTTMYTWTKGGTTVQAASTTSSYTFTPVAADNGQTFICTASNSVGTDPSASLSITVNCKYMASSPIPRKKMFGLTQSAVLEKTIHTNDL